MTSVEAYGPEARCVASPDPFLARMITVVLPVFLRPTFAVVLVCGVVLGPGADQAAAQPQQAAQWPAAVIGDTARTDETLLRAVYRTEAPAFRWAMRGADKSAYPVFIGAPIVAWGAWLAQGREDGRAAYRLTVAQAATYGAVSGLKALVRRPRPYAVLPDIRSRSPRYSPLGPEGDSYAFPSGHAALSFAMVTAWSLAHPEWYVIGPGAVWASAVSLSRVWLGVHYPSDVLTGAALGTALAAGVHVVAPSITPGFLHSDAAAPLPMMHVQIRF